MHQDFEPDIFLNTPSAHKTAVLVLDWQRNKRFYSPMLFNLGAADIAIGFNWAGNGIETIIEMTFDVVWSITCAREVINRHAASEKICIPPAHWGGASHIQRVVWKVDIGVIIENL